MPIKLPKAFPRRKSSGNALEDISSPSEPSFRVLERPPNHSLDGVDTLKRMSQGRPLSAGHLGISDRANSNTLNINNRGSGGTNNSTSSGGHDNSSSSAGFSSSSTLPSSTEASTEERHFPKEPIKMTPPPIPESSGIASLKAAGRAFSFGRRKAEISETSPRHLVEHSNSDGRAYYSRERTHTEGSHTSESTAAPTKLLDTGLDFGSTENFGTMFDGFESRSQTELDRATLTTGQVKSPGEITPESRQYPNLQSAITPPPLCIDQFTEVQASPKSWVSHGSHENLMSSHSPVIERTFSYEDGQERIDATAQRLRSSTRPGSGPSSPPYRKQRQRPPSDGLRISSVYANKEDIANESTVYHDDDARLVMDSINASRRLDSGRVGSYQESDNDDNPVASLVSHTKAMHPQLVNSGAPKTNASDRLRTSPGPAFSHDSDSTVRNARPQDDSVTSTPRARKSDIAYPEERSMFDMSPPPSTRQAPPPPRPNIQAPPKPKTQNKVMTPAQFEQYRKEQEMNRAVSRQTNADSSDEEADDYEDDDEIERNKQLAKERRKQDAHLAVYRQQMMKVTGEQPADLPSIQVRPRIDRSSLSAPNLQNRTSGIDINFDKLPDDGKVSDEEDENVPLGVLAAHGFPSRNRPPTAMSSRDSRIQYKSESYPPPPASTSGASQSGRASGLPPFAKHLPQDPYFGAGLVNSPNREPLAFGHQGPACFGAPAPGMPPGGLVGVIAGEEKAKAARRGSPSAHGNYGSPLPPGMTQIPGMPPGMPPIMTLGEQATVQMSEQMNQMMQMQMQWMQQMQQMMASGMQIPPGQQPPMLPGHPSMMMPLILQPPQPQGHRPASSGPYPFPGAPGGQLQSGRAMSMMSPSPTPPWPSQHGNVKQSTASHTMSGAISGPNVGYAPSIAPSERSNVGNPARYRPVSVVTSEEKNPRSQSRTSTMNSNTLHPGASDPHQRQSSSRDRKSNLALHPSSRTPPQKHGSDDDDEEGWEEMKKKKEKKKSMWRLHKKKDEQADAGALEYYDYSEI